MRYPPCRIDGCSHDSLKWGLCYYHAHQKNARDCGLALLALPLMVGVPMLLAAWLLSMTGR